MTRLSITTNTYSCDDAGQPPSDGAQSYTYDAPGNMLTAGSDTFSWDWKNRTTSATVSGATGLEHKACRYWLMTRTTRTCMPTASCQKSTIRTQHPANKPMRSAQCGE